MKKILLVEDESLIRSYLARALRKEGFFISEAQDAQEAREKLKPEGCDLAIVDLFLKDGMDGLELIPEIHREFPRTKIIIITALAIPEVKEAALREGIDRFYGKPFETSEIRRAVRELLFQTDSSTDKETRPEPQPCERRGNFGLGSSHGGSEISDLECMEYRERKGR